MCLNNIYGEIMKTFLFPILVITFLGLNCTSTNPFIIETVDIWVNQNAMWLNIPDRRETISYSENTNIVYFNKDGSMKIIEFTLYKNKNDTISIGSEGGILYKGDWRFNNDRILIKYRLIERAITLLGENIPSKEIIDTVRITKINGIGNVLIFKNEIFIPNSKFDHQSLDIIRSK
jgi:hypothetical protein